MATTRTHVLLHPYGTADGYKQVKASNDPAAIRHVIDGYERAGWRGYIYTVRAAGFHDAVERLARRLYPGQ
jgi:hypothetical protein